jgi:D-beta-D-heptose 7-phosphate kinase/D-beta-D-heptose 1-phosphate adenosyltransferase
MALRDLVERFAGLAIFVAGDPMTDVYHFGHVDRLSPEAPVPVFVQDSVSRRAGGAANVVANLRSLNIDTRNTFPPYEIWSEKHRYIVGHQQLLRVDQDVNIAADWSGVGNVKDWDALVISDYRKGAFIGPELAKQCEAFAAAGVPIVVDPKGDYWGDYPGGAIICPNHLELEAQRRHDFGRVDPASKWSIVEKCGPDGIRLHPLKTYRGQENAIAFAATARHVFDVTGAGDTVTAIVAATLAAGGTLEEACLLANVAAGYVVGEIGTVTCPVDTLLGLLP